MAATVTRSPAEMVTEADEIEAAKALRNRLAEWKRREGGILS